MASLEFDAEINALYVRLREGKTCRSEPVCDNVIIDLDEKGDPVGVEILLPPDMDEALKERLIAICSKVLRPVRAATSA